MAKQVWFHALTLTGEERHIFNPLPDRPDYLPPDALAMCGKLVRYRLRSQPWADAIPECRLCAARGVTLPGRGACPDEWQPYHDAGSRPEDCATCGLITTDTGSKSGGDA